MTDDTTTMTDTEETHTVGDTREGVLAGLGDAHDLPHETFPDDD